jgi:hypothetical protein
MAQPGHQCFEFFPGVEKVQAKSQVSGIFQPKPGIDFFNQLVVNDENISYAFWRKAKE